MKLQIGELTNLHTFSVEVEEEITVMLKNLILEFVNVYRNIDSTELARATSKLNTDITDVLTKIKNNLNTVNIFMKEQINSYSVTLEEAYIKIENLIKIIDECIDKNGNITNKFSTAEHKALGLFTPSADYDVSKLSAFIQSFEGKGTVVIGEDGKAYYKIMTDTDGSLAAGPGVHLKYIPGIDMSKYSNGGLISKELVDNYYNELLVSSRQIVEDLLNTEKYAGLNLNDAQVDALTSLLYNTGITSSRAEYFLDKYVAAEANGTTLYEYCTQYWVNSDNGVEPGLVRRRKEEAILFEEGYGAWEEWKNNN